MQFVTFDSEKKEWHGVTQPCLLNPKASVGQLLINMLARSPQTIAHVDADTGAKTTNAEMKLKITRAAQNLAELGYGKGDVISLAVFNHPEAIPIACGCLCIGVTVSGLDPSFNKEEYAHLLKSLQSKMIICEESNLDMVREAADSIGLKPKYAIFGPGNSEVMCATELLKETDMEDMYL
jgi:acyl-coenzyme A synthetase/AMP-(fatty) acid ligase